MSSTTSSLQQQQQQDASMMMQPRRILAVCFMLGAIVVLLSLSPPAATPSSSSTIQPGDGNFIKDTSSSSSSSSSSGSKKRKTVAPLVFNEEQQRVRDQLSSDSDGNGKNNKLQTFWTRGTGGRISPLPADSPALSQNPSSAVSPTSGCEIRPNVEREGFLIQCPVIGKNPDRPGKYTINPLFAKGGSGRLEFLIEFSASATSSIAAITGTKCTQTIESRFAHQQQSTKNPQTLEKRDLVPTNNCQSSMTASKSGKHKIKVAVDVGDDDRVEKTIRTILFESKSSSKFEELDYSVFNDLRVVTEVDFKIEIEESEEHQNKWKTCFVAIGDFGRYQQQSKGVATLLEETIARRPEIRFIVSTGDNFYPTGVKSVRDPQFTNVFEKLYSGKFTKPLMWILSAGNHDQWGLPGQLQYGAVTSNRWYFPRPVFDVRFPIVSADTSKVGETGVIAVLDSYGRNVDQQLQQLPSVMLKKTTTQTSTDTITNNNNNKQQDDPKYWKIAVGHMPLYSGSNHGKEARTYSQRPKYKNAFYKAKVNAYLNGDDHMLEVHRVKHDDGVSDTTIDYFTTGAGGGGSNFYDSTVYSTTHLSFPFSAGFTVHCFETNNLEEMTTEFFMTNKNEKQVKMNGNIKATEDAQKEVPVVRTKLMV